MENVLQPTKFRLNPNAVPYKLPSRTTKLDPVEILRREEAALMKERGNNENSSQNQENTRPQGKQRTPKRPLSASRQLGLPAKTPPHSQVREERPTTPLSAKVISPAPPPVWSPARAQTKLVSPEIGSCSILPSSSPTTDDGWTASPHSPFSGSTRKWSSQKRLATSPGSTSVGVNWKQALALSFKQALAQPIVVPRKVLKKFGIVTASVECATPDLDLMKRPSPSPLRESAPTPPRCTPSKFVEKASSKFKGVNPQFLSEFFEVARSCLDEFGPGNLQNIVSQLHQMLKQGKPLEELEEEVGSMPW
eukprot:gb/GEZN01009844.1/.p1 GENE.gb/GEZN01009844.1/~~gb/GEZN01009844.1/.p1  ORF type:complete len:307 (+),score=46.22 gb/GEZN01009844.1/:58-978(+)